MSKIDVTRTEIVWPGKYDENGELVPARRVNLPFQVIERVNETRATRKEREEKLAGHGHWQQGWNRLGGPLPPPARA